MCLLRTVSSSLAALWSSVSGIATLPRHSTARESPAQGGQTSHTSYAGMALGPLGDQRKALGVVHKRARSALPKWLTTPCQK